MLGLYALKYSELVITVVVPLVNVEFELSSESSYHAPSIRGVLFFTFTLLLVA
jgi:hypothetical protein